MIIDKQARFDWDDAITVTRVSTDKIDLVAARMDLGQVDNLFLVVLVTEAFTAAGSATLTVDLVDDDNASLSSPATLQTLASAVGKATLIAGYEIYKGRIPLGKITQRYLGLNYTVATGPMTAGKVRSFLTPNVDAQFAFPKGYVNY